MCVRVYIHTHFYYYVKMLKQTYFVRELAKRAASSGCSCPAVLLLLLCGVCVLHLFASFVSAKVFCTFVQIHSIWHPLPVTSSSFCCCYCCIASLNTLANILALFFPTTSFRCLPPFVAFSLHLPSAHSVIQCFSSILQHSWIFLSIKSGCREGGGEGR